ncbi:hypothetical protein RvY_04262 [Ramazzottius varieornatus]|uniref:Uncharacterized protein n=1 Tax=Ramazzottius varieornatus TaxID=947166 RepID=A0A1D1UR27_RAMVA|nr:hypothetical protein RvY_04262 [Ramazzottius varieornatus]
MRSFLVCALALLLVVDVSFSMVLRQKRDQLPSIVSDGRKTMGSEPAGNPGVPPAAIAQAQGNLEKRMMPNPFGSNPAMIPVGN